MSYKKNPSHMLSPFPLFPTVFIPSFQSPAPILGNPFSPKSSFLLIAFMQCSYIFSFSSVYSYLLYFSSSPSSSSIPQVYSTSLSRMLISSVNSIYSKTLYGNHNKSSEIFVLIPDWLCSCHQCITSPSLN